MIDHTHRFIFIHIPKTGGTSLEMAFGHEEYSQTKHLNAKNYSYLLGDTFSEYKKISIIRNPWDRVLSFYMYRKMQNTLPNDVNSLIDWVHFIRHKKDLFAGIHDYLSNDDSICCDLLLNFHNLEEDFGNFCKSLNISLELPHKNKTRHNHYTEYYDKDSEEIVAEKYAKDIEYFGYKFGELC